ncbi:MAG: sce7726 family protein [Candidatus Paceibacterota bacterium]
MHTLKKTAQTNDIIIREALVKRLENEYDSNPEYRVIPELGLWHGASRVDVAVVNGVLHGFEIKSDRDTLNRLPSQREAYNSVFDKVTLVVGAKHFVDAFKIVPNWWGIETAHLDENGSVFFNIIRQAGENPKQDEISIARLLWKNEALDLLESEGKAGGVRSKPRELVYERVAETIEIDVLKKYVRNVLQGPRQNWRSDLQLA